MLVPYTPVSSLSPEEVDRLRVMVSRLPMESQGPHINFEGKVLQVSEVMNLRAAGIRKILHG